LFVPEQPPLGHPYRHLSQPLRLAPDLPELYIVYAVDAFVAGVDYRHVVL
jgi:hypothetical protein